MMAEGMSNQEGAWLCHVDHKPGTVGERGLCYCGKQQHQHLPQLQELRAIIAQLSGNKLALGRKVSRPYATGLH